MLKCNFKSIIIYLTIFVFTSFLFGAFVFYKHSSIKIFLCPLKVRVQSWLSSDFNNPSDYFPFFVRRVNSPINLMHDMVDKGNKLTDQKIGKGMHRPAQFIIGYTNKFLYTEGEDIDVYYAGDVLLKGDRLEKFVILDAVDNTIKYEETFKNPLPLKRQGCHNFYSDGCRFSSQFRIPTSQLGVGEYSLVLVSNKNENSHPIYFNVRLKEINSGAPEIVVMFANHTWQAYNYEGGGSFYGINRTSQNGVERYQPKQRYYAISMNRPIVGPPYESGSKNLLQWNFSTAIGGLVFLKVLREAGIAYRTTSNTDLHHHPEVLNNAKVLVFAAHDEYWTHEMHDSISSFIKKGGNVANFSGNIAWWYVNLVGENLYCKKNSVNKEVHKNFRDTGSNNNPAINLPVEKIFGLSYRYAGYPVKDSYQTLEKAEKAGCSKEIYEASDYITILNPNHPVFENTHLKYGDKWSGSSKVIGGELDGVPLNEFNIIDAHYKSRFPAEINILATATASSTSPPFSRVGIFIECKPFANGGKVISFGSINYGASLAIGDTISKKIFLNAIKYLAQPEKFTGVLITKTTTKVNFNGEEKKSETGR